MSEIREFWDVVDEQDRPAPTYEVWTINRRFKKPIFTKIGAAFKCRDKDGYNVSLSAMPLDGQFLLRLPGGMFNNHEKDNDK